MTKWKNAKTTVRVNTKYHNGDKPSCHLVNEKDLSFISIGCMYKAVKEKVYKNFFVVLKNYDYFFLFEQ